MKCDESLVKRAITGDTQAFEELYSQIYGDMYRFSFFMLGNREDAIDAVSDTVFDMYRYIGRLKHYKSFSSWCMKILWGKCKQKRKEYITRSIETAIDDAP